jgi:dihydrodipicolinate synthase/N-acetylneuraminate lyase
MFSIMQSNLAIRGIVSAVQTPFTEAGHIDFDSLYFLVEDAIAAGVDGLLAPVVASEVEFLSSSERRKILTTILQAASSNLPVIIGASDRDALKCRYFAKWAADNGAAAYLVAVPNALYQQPNKIISFFQQVSQGINFSLIVQDFEFNGPGMNLDMICTLKKVISSLVGIKIETNLAGLKYTMVREALGDDFFIAGGWAVTQFIEALDRGVDAMIPESSMIRVYKRIQRHYEHGARDEAKRLFHRLLPILTFTNQDVSNSILFFKYLLVRKGIFRSIRMRCPEPGWDRYSLQVAEELIELYLELEEEDQ